MFVSLNKWYYNVHFGIVLMFYGSALQKRVTETLTTTSSLGCWSWLFFLHHRRQQRPTFRYIYCCVYVMNLVRLKFDSMSTDFKWTSGRIWNCLFIREMIQYSCWKQSLIRVRVDIEMYKCIRNENYIKLLQFLKKKKKSFCSIDIAAFIV